MRWRRVIAAALVASLAGGVLHVDAFVPKEREADDDLFSPLFARRLEVGVGGLDGPRDTVQVARLQRMQADKVLTPLSFNPVSACLGSLCLGSACISSFCLGSACINSKCLGSGCVASVCGGSGCAMSVCGGSACAVSACASACFHCIEDPVDVPHE
ncbi:MAG: hypothetical protein ACREAA_21575 [Candidatus Polarisedimenticolia bacterium]